MDLDELERLRGDADDVAGKGFQQNADAYSRYDDALHAAAPELIAAARRLAKIEQAMWRQRIVDHAYPGEELVLYKLTDEKVPL